MDGADFHVRDMDHHPRAPYAAKDFDEQESYMLLLTGAKGRNVEVGVYLHWLDGQPVDVAIDVSCMSGCTESCTFCAAAKLRGPRLSAEQIAHQVREALEHIAVPRADFLKALGPRPRLTVSFQGMGEPSRMAQIVVDAMDLIREKYGSTHDLQFMISTLMRDATALSVWAHLNPPLHSLQVSLHGTEDETRSRILGKDIPLEGVFVALDAFAEQSPSTEIKLNYLLIRDKNDSEEDAARLCQLLDGRSYYLKISRLNETQATSQHRLNRPTESRFNDFLNYCRNKRPEELTYAYGSRDRLKISCGQLAGYASRDLDPETRRSMADIYQRVIEGNAALFLGAGASPIWSANSLAEELYQTLGFNLPFKKSGLTLAQVADIYTARDIRQKIYQILRDEMRVTPVPMELVKLAAFPWKAIFTTNYDEFMEHAYDAAAAQSKTDYRVQPIRVSTDLCAQLPEGYIPLVKLHGCITRSADEQVIADDDYLSGYDQNRKYLFKMFEVEALRRDIVFVGYGFKDQYLRQLMAKLKDATSGAGTAAYAVLPPSEFTTDLAQTLKHSFHITLVPATVQQFADELSRLARKPVALISGSRRSDIRSAPSTNRPDAGSRLGELAELLGEQLSREEVHVVTGATAKDKFGYMVASGMDHGLATTYVWRGAEQVKDGGNADDIRRMINLRWHGTNAAEVIAKTVDLAQVVIFAGGSAITLQEYQVASSKSRVMIPIALGDRQYASDVIHAFFYGNLDVLRRFDSDPGLRQKEAVARRQARLLSEERLNRLRLDREEPAVVVDAVMEIVRESRMMFLG